MAGVSPQGLRYAGGLFGVVCLCWLALAALGHGGNDVFRLLIWSWFVPLPYVAAWSALTVATPRQATLATASLALVNAVLTLSGFAVGFASFGVLSLPAFIGCGALFGYVAAQLHARITPGAASGEWLNIHCRGGAAAAGGLMATMLIGTVEASYWPSTLLRYAVLGAILSTGFAWHAQASWWKMRDDEMQHAAELSERGKPPGKAQ